MWNKRRERWAGSFVIEFRVQKISVRAEVVPSSLRYCVPTCPKFRRSFTFLRFVVKREIYRDRIFKHIKYAYAARWPPTKINQSSEHAASFSFFLSLEIDQCGCVYSSRLFHRAVDQRSRCISVKNRPLSAVLTGLRLLERKTKRVKVWVKYLI